MTECVWNSRNTELIYERMRVSKSKARRRSRSNIQAERGRWRRRERQTQLACSGIDSGPLEAASSIYQFVSFLLSSSPPPIFPLSGGSFVGNKQRRSGTPDPRLLGNHTLTWWSGGNFRGLCENSIKVVIRPESPITPTCTQSVAQAYALTQHTWRHVRNMFKRCIILATVAIKQLQTDACTPVIICISGRKSNTEQNLLSDCYYGSYVLYFTPLLWTSNFSFATLSVFFFFMRYSGRTSSLLPAKDECGFYNNRDSY